MSYSSKRAAQFALVAAILLLGLASCGVKKDVTVRTRKLFGAELDFHAHVAPNANMNNPVAVEVILVYDKKLADTLEKTNAKDWFMNRDQFKRDHAKDFDSWYWEWIPGQKVKDSRLPLKAKTKVTLVFANYLVPGDNRAKVDPYHNITINLGEREFTATQE